MELFDSRIDSRPRWASFENPTGDPGEGGLSNNGAKGSPSRYVESGEEVTLLDAHGGGVVRKIWMALDRYTEREAMRSLSVRMYWDGAKEPAVDCPIGEFFGHGTGRVAAFDSALASSPEGRSLNCFIPMPFYKSAKITFYNPTCRRVLLFYDVEYTLEELRPGALYFHAERRRESPVALGEPYTVLSRTRGRGRYLGTSFGVITDRESYGDTWFGEGEIKFYLDGNFDTPTLVGTGTEDYIGDGWGQGTFCNATQGCTVASDGEYAFYRWHTVDPICFHDGIKVTLQAMGNGTRREVRDMQKRGVPLTVTSVAGVGVYKPGERVAVGDGDPDDSVLFFRCDDYSSVAYFYYEKP